MPLGILLNMLQNSLIFILLSLIGYSKGFSHVSSRLLRAPVLQKSCSTLKMAFAIQQPLPPSAIAPLKVITNASKGIFRALPLPFKVIATILTTLFTLVLIEDFTDWASSLIEKFRGKSKAEKDVEVLIKKQFTPTKSSVAIRFLQSGKDSVDYGAEVGAKLSQVAADAAVVIKYDCMKGQCGTCSVKVGNKWIKTCQTSIPTPSQPNEVYEVIVPKASIKSSKFFSPRSFLDGVWNNALGMVGFVGQIQKADKQYKARLERERQIAEKVKLAKLAKGQAP